MIAIPVVVTNRLLVGSPLITRSLAFRSHAPDVPTGAENTRTELRVICVLPAQKTLVMIAEATFSDPEAKLDTVLLPTTTYVFDAAVVQITQRPVAPSPEMFCLNEKLVAAILVHQSLLFC